MRERALKTILAFAAGLFISPAALSAEISSVYTDIAPSSCITIAKAAEGDGDWATQICQGFTGYPVILDYGDARESVFYGFPKTGDSAWESFDAFNSTARKIEWRVRKDGDVTVPFATIHRWSVSNPEDEEKKIEVLAVEKVGQPKDGAGCTVGLVVATGNPQANETARKIADEQAESFACGGDERTLVGEPMPSFGSQQN